MMYLKPLIKRLTTDNDIIRNADNLKNDEELLSYISNIFSIDKVKDMFYHHYGMEYINLKTTHIDKNSLDKFDLNLLKKRGMIPLYFDESNSTYHFAISDLLDRDTIELIRKTCESNGEKVIFSFALKHEIINTYKEIESETIETKNYNTSDEKDDFDAKQWVETILNKGIDLKCSDVHIERLKNNLQVRYRVDGRLTNKVNFNLSNTSISNIYVRLKIISNMDIVEKRKSQDGRIDNYEYKNNLYDMRVSTVNTIYGEKFVLRLFDKDDKVSTFEELGFTEVNKKKTLNMLNNKNGIIYLAGATGSGKTTTLYTMIEELNNERVNIYTIENPVEKTINNVNQIQIDKASGTTYPTVLQSLLRQDPDVIVVGEIRDKETAELSVRASLTGHLVMSTLHANNAIDSLSRLSDMGIESYLIGASSIGFISQVLIRLICPKCKMKKNKLKEHEEIWIKNELPNFDYEESKSKGNYVYESVGCEHCTDGYRGRIALTEVLDVDEKLRSMISKKTQIDVIKKYILDNGYKTLKHDGIIKALSGITSLDELIGHL